MSRERAAGCLSVLRTFNPMHATTVFPGPRPGSFHGYQSSLLAILVILSDARRRLRWRACSDARTCTSAASMGLPSLIVGVSLACSLVSALRSPSSLCPVALDCCSMCLAFGP